MFMRRKYLAYLGALLLAGSLVAVGIIHASGPDKVTLPEGTTLTVALDNTVGSRHSQPGDSFAATVIAPVVVNGKTVIPQSTHARGRVLSARESGRLEGAAYLAVTLDAIEVNGDWYEVDTNSIARRGPGHKKNNWGWIGGGAGGGLLIGALAGGAKGAAIGGPVGAGAGLGAALLTGKRDVRFSGESRLTFKLKEPLTVEMKS